MRSDLKPEKEETKTDWIESTDILTIQICSLGNPRCTIDIPGYLHITLEKGEKRLSILRLIKRIISLC